MVARSPAPPILTWPPAHMAAMRKSPGARAAEWLPLPVCPATSTGWKDMVWSAWAAFMASATPLAMEPGGPAPVWWSSHFSAERQ
eukprot:16439348-Heterocapsa_arctica.AAC.1